MAAKNIYPTWRATVDSTGQLLIHDKIGFNQHVALYADNDNMAIIIRPYRKHRSRQEEKYYHAVTKMMVAGAMDLAPEQAHDFLRQMFLIVEESAVVDGKTVRYTRVKSTTELNDQEYREYWQRCNQWASLPTGDGLDHDSGLGIYIPDPNEADWESYF